jgi:hypothetical protein
MIIVVLLLSNNISEHLQKTGAYILACTINLIIVMINTEVW